MSRQITVTVADLGSAADEGTVVVAVGTDVDTGERVKFGGDHRMMSAFLEAALCDGEATAEVEDYLVLRVEPAPVEYSSPGSEPEEPGS